MMNSFSLKPFTKFSITLILYCIYMKIVRNWAPSSLEVDFESRDMNYNPHVMIIVRLSNASMRSFAEI